MALTSLAFTRLALTSFAVTLLAVTTFDAGIILLGATGLLAPVADLVDLAAGLLLMSDFFVTGIFNLPEFVV